jgi:hypothetical protein
MGMSDAGKGDTYRPVNFETYCKNWEEIFGCKKKKKSKSSKNKSKNSKK